MRNVSIGTSLAAVLLLGILGFPDDYGLKSAQAQTAGTESLLSDLETGQCKADNTFAIAIHGGSVFWRGAIHASKIPIMTQILTDARSLLANGARAVDVVEAAIASMESSGYFNAGKGAIANQAVGIELDASIMDGRQLQAGAVAAVSNLRNPIVAARLVMDKSDHVMMVGPNAELFIEQNGGIVVDVSYFLHGGENFSGVPLPDDVSISAADNGNSSERIGYLGIWAGVIQGDFNHILVVEKIEGDKAKVIYGQGPHPADFHTFSESVSTCRSWFCRVLLVRVTLRAR